MGRWHDEEDAPQQSSSASQPPNKKARVCHGDAAAAALVNQVRQAHSSSNSVTKTRVSTSNSQALQRRPEGSKEEGTPLNLASSRHNPLISGCRSVDCYEPLNFIDQGTFGEVFRAKCLDTDGIYAIKKIKLGASATSKYGFPITALREASILLTLDHPSIVKVREVVVGSTVDKVYMVMEHGGKDLKDVMCSLQKTRGDGSAFSLGQVKQLLGQLLSAVAYMHKHWYIHRDIKTSNLLYKAETGRLTICDFGLSRRFGDPINALTAEVVTLWYRCPELLLGERTYDSAVDVWSCGCVLGELLTGQALFPGQGEADQLKLICAVLGWPHEAAWKGITTKPNYATMIGNRLAQLNNDSESGNSDASRSEHNLELHGIRRRFHRTASHAGNASLFLSAAGCDLLASLLRYDPHQRISARQALDHAWFKEEPQPTPAAHMPAVSENY